MTAVAESRLKGNYGTATVMARLSAECLVRPVAVDTDIGVDLYCETVDNGRPFLHFWLQVKAGDQCRVWSDSTKASCSFKIDHLKYWFRQPVPVFAALVPTTWPVSSEPSIYIVDITTQLLATSLPADRQEMTLESNYHWPPGSAERVREFLTDVVPQTTARLQVSIGVVAAIQTPTPTYVKTTPFVPVIHYRSEIQKQLRLTAANSIIFALSQASGPPKPCVLAFCRRLAGIVERLEDDEESHWENFMARALVAHAKKEYERALDLYNSAHSCIKADHHVHDDPQWQQRLEWIESFQACARKHRPLHETG